MGLFAWFRRKPAPLTPEARWCVRVEEDSIRVHDDDGQTHAIALAELASIAIATNDSGPWAADVWWLLHDGDGALAVQWPQGARGEEQAIAVLTGWPGFDQAALGQAMRSTGNARFLVWQRR